MKRMSFKMIVACSLLAFFAINSYGQTPTKSSKGDEKKVAKLEKSKVPKEITDIYFRDYPGITYFDWYGFPSYDYGPYWYDDWYDYGPYSYIDIPEYYVVEFNKDSTATKAIYSKTGGKVATHKVLTSDLPKAVSATVSKGEYKTWKLGKDKEEIFKDSDKDQLKVYKVTVEKGKEKHTLFIQSDGKLLKDKKVS